MKVKVKIAIPCWVYTECEIDVKDKELLETLRNDILEEKHIDLGDDCYKKIIQAVEEKGVDINEDDDCLIWAE